LMAVLQDDYAIALTLRLSDWSLLIKFKKPYKIERLKKKLLQAWGVTVWTTSRAANCEKLLSRLGLAS
jgi:hypothetical protein